MKGISNGTEGTNNEPVTDFNRICKILEESSVAGNICDGRRKFIFVNEACANLCGYAKEDMLGRSPRKLLQGNETNQTVNDSIRARLEQGTPFGFSIKNFRQSGEAYVVGTFVIPFVDGLDSKLHFVGIWRELQTPTDSVALDGPEEFREVIASILKVIGG